MSCSVTDGFVSRIVAPQGQRSVHGNVAQLRPKPWPSKAGAGAEVVERSG